ncbi:TonB-dependent receptor plug domain-containing protein [Achromobacter insuavis]
MPVSVSVFDGGELQDLRTANAESVLRMTPNVGYSALGDGRSTHLSIRGIGTMAQPLGSDDTSVVAYVDGVPQPCSPQTSNCWTWSASRCCAARKARCSAATRRPAPSTSSRASPPTPWKWRPAWKPAAASTAGAGPRSRVRSWPTSCPAGWRSATAARTARCATWPGARWATCPPHRCAARWWRAPMPIPP